MIKGFILRSLQLKLITLEFVVEVEGIGKWMSRERGW